MSKQYKKHSLGTLRQAARTKDKSPNLIGQIALQRSDIIAIHRYLQETGSDEAICNLAGWFYAWAAWGPAKPFPFRFLWFLASSNFSTSEAKYCCPPGHLSFWLFNSR